MIFGFLKLFHFCFPLLCSLLVLRSSGSPLVFTVSYFVQGEGPTRVKWSRHDAMCVYACKVLGEGKVSIRRNFPGTDTNCDVPPGSYPTKWRHPERDDEARVSSMAVFN